MFSQGDTADAVFYIQEGRVKLTVVSEQGKEAIIAVLGKDDFFGEGCLAGQQRRVATVASNDRKLDYAAREGCDHSDASSTDSVFRFLPIPSFGSDRSH